MLNENIGERFIAGKRMHDASSVRSMLMLDFVMCDAIMQRLACGELLRARIGGGALDEIKFLPAPVVKRNCKHCTKDVVRPGNRYEGALKVRWSGFFWRKFVSGCRGGSLLYA